MSPVMSGGFPGAVYYVHPGIGDNNNAGTSPFAPWDTLGRALSGRKAGDTVRLQGGQTFSGTLTPTVSGTNQLPITWTSYGTGRPIIPGGVSLTNVHWNYFRNLEIDGPSQGVQGSLSGSGSSHILVDNCEIVNVNIGVNCSNHGDAFWTISGSHIHETQDSGLILEGPDAQVVLCEIENTGLTDLGYASHGIYSKSMRARIIANDIHDFRNEGVSTRYRNALIAYNSIHDSSVVDSGAIGYYNYDAGGRGTSIVRFNKIWACGYGLYVSPGSSGGDSLPGMPENWIVHNNTMLGTGAAIDIQPAAGPGGVPPIATMVIIKNNAMQGWSTGVVSNAHTAVYAEDHNLLSSNLQLSAAPNLVPTSAASPVVNAGTQSIPGLTLTYDGTAPDIGAVEFQQ